MAEFLIMLKNVLIFIALALPAYLLTKKKTLSGKDCSALSQILLYVAVPFLVFCSALDVTLTSQTAVEFLLIGLLTAIGQLVCCLLTGFLPGLREDTQQKSVMRFSMVFGNNGFLGLPLVSVLFSESLPITVAYFSIISIVTNLLILGVGDYIIGGKKTASCCGRSKFQQLTVRVVVIDSVMASGTKGIACANASLNVLFGNF